MGFPRQEYWSGLPFPSPGNLPDTGVEPGSPELQEDFYCWATREACRVRRDEKIQPLQARRSWFQHTPGPRFYFVGLWNWGHDEEEGPGAFSFPSSSEGKKSAFNAGDLDSVLGSGRFSRGGMATHSSVPAWRTPWTEEPGGLQLMES